MIAAGLIGVVLVLASTGLDAATTVKRYARGRSGYRTVPLLSVGDSVPQLGDPTRSYRMVGIPDGLGATRTRAGVELYMNHEFDADVLSQPVVGGTRVRGAFVSRWILNDAGDPVGGDLAFRSVFQDNRFVGPIATASNTTRAFGRFCSATMAGEELGFDREIFFTNEEETGGGSFDGRGGQTVAVFGGEAHALSGLGHFSKENDVVWPNDGRRTVIMSLEDGPSSPDSQLYMYVGTKNPDAPSVLGRNGLINGQLYVFVSAAEGKNDEASFARGEIAGGWAPIAGAAEMDGGELESAADDLGAFAFVRIEDGAFAKTNRNDFFFATTGGNAAAGNALGRIYHLKLNQNGILEPPRLGVVLNADRDVALHGDAPVSPDNMDTSSRFLMVQEDATSTATPVLRANERDVGIWRLELDTGLRRTTVVEGSQVLAAEVTPPGRDGASVPLGSWESSGIIDASAWFGPNTWLFEVQAHEPTTPPTPNAIEDAQLLLLNPRSRG
jgi:uncharacterized protein DUF839